jgi:hypothetical protein
MPHESKFCCLISQREWLLTKTDTVGLCSALWMNIWVNCCRNLFENFPGGCGFVRSFVSLLPEFSISFSPCACLRGSPSGLVWQRLNLFPERACVRRKIHSGDEIGIIGRRQSEWVKAMCGSLWHSQIIGQFLKPRAYSQFCWEWNDMEQTSAAFLALIL